MGTCGAHKFSRFNIPSDAKLPDDAIQRECRPLRDAFLICVTRLRRFQFYKHLQSYWIPTLTPAKCPVSMEMDWVNLLSCIYGLWHIMTNTTILRRAAIDLWSRPKILYRVEGAGLMTVTLILFTHKYAEASIRARLQHYVCKYSVSCSNFVYICTLNDEPACVYIRAVMYLTWPLVLFFRISKMATEVITFFCRIVQKWKRDKGKHERGTIPKYTNLFGTRCRLPYLYYITYIPIL